MRAWKKRHRRRLDKIAADTARAWKLIEGGMSPAQAAQECGFGPHTHMLFPLPRTEAQIRDDLTLQLERIHRNFLRWVRP